MFREQLQKLRRRLAGKMPLFISIVVTAAALAVYNAAFIGERPTHGTEFINRMEMATLDFRFQQRGELPPDPRIVIVDIDQRAQEVLGRWPFHRGHFAKMLDALVPATAALLIAVTLAGCAGGVGVPPPVNNAGTPAGNYTITVTATSASGMSRTTTLGLTVQ